MSARARRQPVSTDKRFRKNTDGLDHGTIERWQHSGRVLQMTEAAGKRVARATEEHVVDVLVKRKIITLRQREAAMKLKEDYHLAGLAAHVTGSYNPIRAGKDYGYNAPERNDVGEAAYQRWRNAVRELGVRLGNAVVSTACHDSLPLPRDVEALQLGLDKLVRWYRLPKADDAQV